MDSAHPVTGESAPSHGYGFLGLRTQDDRSEVELYREAAAQKKTQARGKKPKPAASQRGGGWILLTR
jgi:hypothetical protein